MKVIHILNNLNQGGAEAFVADLALVRPSSSEIWCLVGSKTEAHKYRTNELTRSGVSVKEFSRAIGLVRGIVTAAREGAVFHCHNLRALLSVVLVKALVNGKFPIVFTQHIDFLKRPSIHALIYRWVDAYVAICSGAYTDIKERVPVAPFLITNGVSSFDANVESYHVAGRINVALIARFSRQKGHDVFVRSLVELRSLGALEKFHFWLIGEGDLKDQIVAAVDKNGLNSYVTFLGNVNNARGSLASYEALMLSSYWEGMPIVVLEALQAGVPVLSTAVGGVCDLVSHEHNGLLSAPGDAKALAKNLTLLLDDGFRLALARGARLKSDDYSISACYEKYSRVYDFVVGKYSKA